MNQSNYKISLCVVSMNRLHQLKKTLLKNIEDSKDYEELEFIVLDYNSKDGMERWAKKFLSEYIHNGRVVYYKTHEAESWSPSHSKNLAFKLATGDIVCNLWADYYMGPGFPHFVNNSFKSDNKIVLTPIDFHKTKKNHAPSGDVLGKVCVKKTDFLNIKGFDERMNKHGFEDYDLINRLEMTGIRRVLIEDFEFLKYLKHSDSERFKLPTDNLESLYINYLTPSESMILLIYKDLSFQMGVVIDHSISGCEDPQRAYMMHKHHFQYSLKLPGWTTGVWSKIEKDIICFKTRGDNEFTLIKKNKAPRLVDPETGTLFYRQLNESLIDEVLRFHHFIYTRLIMEQNMSEKAIVVNKNSFGEATVYKNFNSISPIRVH